MQPCDDVAAHLVKEKLPTDSVQVERVEIQRKFAPPCNPVTRGK